MTVFFNISTNTSLKNLTNTSCKIVKKSLVKLINKKIENKKPNDLLINKKKVCGILQEIIFYNNFKFAIVGIGVNIIKSPVISYAECYIDACRPMTVDSTSHKTNH